jgi:putative polyhydroxyalkanoate system protein
MTTINLEQSHSLGLEGARTRVEGLVPTLVDKYGVKVDWRGDNAHFAGKGFSGVLQVRADTVAIDLKLGLLARPFAGKIKSAMAEHVRKALA